MFLKHKLSFEPRCDLVAVAGEHVRRAAAVVEADECLGDDEAALRQLRAVGGSSTVGSSFAMWSYAR